MGMMSVKRGMILAALAVVLTVPTVCAVENANVAAFRKSRFGLFLHWGLYAQLGGRWKAQKMGYIGEWIQSKYCIPNAEYAALAKDFNPVQFDADAWAREAKAAGMGYVVLTAKHHEGFAMFATKVSDYNIVDATPFKRDVFGELVAACRRHGLKVGFYYSQNLDWHEEDGGDPEKGGLSKHPLNKGMHWGNSWDFPDYSKKDLNRYLKAKVYPQVRELLTNYGDIFLIWFDTPKGMTVEQSRELREFVRSIQPNTLVNSRIGNGLGDFGSMHDNQMPVGKNEFPFESPMTLNDTWGFKYDDHNWKSADTVACALMQNISCNANLILNIGPRPDGRFPDAASDVLADLAAWRRTSGVRIAGAGASPFAQVLPWGWVTVVDGNVLQLVVRTDWTGDLEICGLKNRVSSCSTSFRQDGETLRVTMPPATNLMPRVVFVTLDGAPTVEKLPMPQNGEIILTPSSDCAVESGGGEEKCHVTDRGAFLAWHHPGDAISWQARFAAPGRYRVLVRTENERHSQPWCDDRTVEVSVGTKKVSGALRHDAALPHSVYDRAESVIGEVDVAQAGACALQVKTLAAGEAAVTHALIALRIVAVPPVPPAFDPVVRPNGEEDEKTAVHCRERAASVTTQGVRNVLVLGDSLSDYDRGSNHWDIVAKYLNATRPEKISFYNYAVAGDFAQRTMDRLDGKGNRVERFGDIMDRSYDWAFVMLGANDTKAMSDERYVTPVTPPDREEALYREFVRRLKARGVKRIFLVSCARADWAKCQANALALDKIRPKHSRFGEPRHMEAFNAVLKKLADEIDGVEYLDIYTPMQRIDDISACVRPADGVHLVTPGYRFVARTLLDCLSSINKQ